MVNDPLLATKTFCFPATPRNVHWYAHTFCPMPVCAAFRLSRRTQDDNLPSRKTAFIPDWS